MITNILPRLSRATWISVLLLTTAPHAYSVSEQKEPTVRAARAEPDSASQAQARAILMKMTKTAIEHGDAWFARRPMSPGARH